MNAATSGSQGLQNGVGMMWKDTSGVGVSKSLLQGVAYIRKKYNQTPNICFINHLETAKKKLHGMKIIKVSWVRPNQYYFRIEATGQ